MQIRSKDADFRPDRSRANVQRGGVLAFELTTLKGMDLRSRCKCYNQPLLRARRAASMRLAAPSLLIASDK